MRGGVSYDLGVTSGCGQCPGTGFQKLDPMLQLLLHLLLVFTHSGINFEPMGEVLVASYLSFDAKLPSELASFKDQPQMKRV